MGSERGSTDSSPSAGTSWRDVVSVVVLAAVVRVAYLLGVVGHAPSRSDADQYLDIARNLLAGNGVAMQWPQLHVHPTAFRPPLYPALLAGWRWVVGSSILAARTLDVVVGCGVVAMTYVVGRRLGGRRAGIVAAALVAVYPPLVFNDATTLAEPLALLLLLGITWAATDRRWALVGLGAGLLTLTKPAAQGLLVVLVVLGAAVELWERRGVSWRRRAIAALRTGGMVAVAGLVVIVPWIVRNQVELGTTSIVTSNGFTLEAVYGRVAQRRGEFVDTVYDPAYQSLHYRLLRLDEAAWNDELTSSALRALRRHPGYLVVNAGRNLRRWFELTPRENDHAEWLDGRNLDVRHWTVPVFYPVTLVGLAGLGLAMRPRREQDRRRPAAPDGGAGRLGALVLASAAAYFTVASVLTVAVPRLRAPFDLACCVGVGLLVEVLTERRRAPGTSRRSRACGPRSGPGPRR